MISEIFIINLERRADRKERILRELNPFPVPMTVWPACDGELIDTPKDWPHSRGFWGARCSHENVLNECLRIGIRYPLVLEDDCCFTPGWFDRACARVAHLEQRCPSWHCLYLGGNHALPHEAVDELGVARAVETYMIHAVVYNHRYIRNMLGALDYFYPKHPDQAYAAVQKQRQIFVSVPNLVGQHPGHSDNNNRHDEGVPIAPVPG